MGVGSDGGASWEHTWLSLCGGSFPKPEVLARESLKRQRYFGLYIGVSLFMETSEQESLSYVSLSAPGLGKGLANSRLRLAQKTDVLHVRSDLGMGFLFLGMGVKDSEAQGLNLKM